MSGSDSGVVGGSGVVDDSGVGSVQLDFFSSLFRVRYFGRNKIKCLQLECKCVDFQHPVLYVQPTLLCGPSDSLNSKEVLLCERVQVSGHLRLKLQSYARALRVTVVPSASVPERLHSRINICFHR